MNKMILNITRNHQQFFVFSFFFNWNKWYISNFLATGRWTLCRSCRVPSHFIYIPADFNLFDVLHEIYILEILHTNCHYSLAGGGRFHRFCVRGYVPWGCMCGAPIWVKSIVRRRFLYKLVWEEIGKVCSFVQTSMHFVLICIRRHLRHIRRPFWPGWFLFCSQNALTAPSKFSPPNLVMRKFYLFFIFWEGHWV